MAKSKPANVNPHKKVKTRGSVWIPGGLRDVLMGSSKEGISKKK